MSRAVIGLLPLDLLRRHVVERPEDGARPGHGRQGGEGHVRGRREADRRPPHQPREAEIEQLHVRRPRRAAAHDHDVRRLQIAVHDALPMGALERSRDLFADRQDLVERQTSALDPARQRLSLDELHDQVVGLLIVADVVERADVRIVQCRDGARFALEARPRLRIGGERRRQPLDRDRAVEPRVAPAIHLAHAARAEQTGELIGTEARARGDGGQPCLECARDYTPLEAVLQLASLCLELRVADRRGSRAVVRAGLAGRHPEAQATADQSARPCQQSAVSAKIRDSSANVETASPAASWYDAAAGVTHASSR